MNEQEFLHNMETAQALVLQGNKALFIKGYLRGLQRHYHGETFGYPGEHEQFQRLAVDEDESRSALGLGYMAGLNGTKIEDLVGD
jgi:hypothetical protein